MSPRRGSCSRSSSPRTVRPRTPTTEAMHYLRAGTGAPTLAFVHGFGCSHEDWLLQINALKNRFETVTWDLRGHGMTPGQAQECSIENFGGDVAALLSVLDLRKTVLIGHS